MSHSTVPEPHSGLGQRHCHAVSAGGLHPPPLPAALPHWHAVAHPRYHTSMWWCAPVPTACAPIPLPVSFSSLSAYICVLPFSRGCRPPSSPPPPELAVVAQQTRSRKPVQAGIGFSLPRWLMSKTPAMRGSLARNSLIQSVIQFPSSPADAVGKSPRERCLI